VTIGAMAAVTERLRFVTGVYVLGARNLFVTAKAVGTAAVLSGGRVLLGVGSGWCRQEFELGGQPFAGRGERMEETIEALRVLWRDEAPEFEGRFTKFSGVDVRPLPPGPVPVLVGGDSDRALRRAATIGDGWIGLDYKEDRLLERLEVLRRLREEAGRTAGPFEIIAAVRARPDPAMHERLAAAGVTGLIAVPWLSTRKDPAPLENKIEAIQQFARTFT
jgi:probable F420-dependent oxidoreductase